MCRPAANFAPSSLGPVVGSHTAPCSSFDVVRSTTLALAGLPDVPVPAEAGAGEGSSAARSTFGSGMPMQSIAAHVDRSSACR